MKMRVRKDIKAIDDSSYNYVILSEMIKLAGKIIKVKELISEDGYYKDSTMHCTWHKDWLEPVEEPMEIKYIAAKVKNNLHIMKGVNDPYGVVDRMEEMIGTIRNYYMCTQNFIWHKDCLEFNLYKDIESEDFAKGGMVVINQDECIISGEGIQELERRIKEFNPRILHESTYSIKESDLDKYVRDGIISLDAKNIILNHLTSNHLKAE